MATDSRPRMKLILSPTDKLVEVFGYILLVLLWVYTLLHYRGLPDTIPVHYGLAGEPDRYGGKGNLLGLPVVTTVLFAGLTILNRFPHLFNYPSDISEENAFKLYTGATRLIRYLKLMIVIIFGFIIVQTVRVSEGLTSGLGLWFLLIVLMAFIVFPIIFLIRMQK